MDNRASINSLPAAMMDFFGKKPGQTTAEFVQELKGLTPEDKAEFRQDLKERGYNV